MYFIGFGMDLVDIRRLVKIQTISRVAEYVLTVNEQNEMFSNSESACRFLASRFAAKEAIIKAFPHNLRPIDCEIYKIGNKPAVRFLREEDKDFHAILSIAHENNLAIAGACVFKGEW